MSESSQVRKWSSPLSSDPELRVSNPFPLKGDCHDWFYDSERCEWISVLDTLPVLEFPKDAEFSQIIVPTAFTAQMSYFCCNMLPARVSPLIVGPTGTGKSVCVAKALTKELDQDAFQSILLGFSAKTSANMTQEIIGGQLNKRRKGVYGPPVGKKSVVFVDDM